MLPILLYYGLSPHHFVGIVIEFSVHWDFHLAFVAEND